MGGKAGELVRQGRGYDAFIPRPLPPDIEYDDELHLLLSEADAALVRLEGVAGFLPDPGILVAMYVKKEALLSTQIDDAQVSLRGVLEFGKNLRPKENIRDIRKVISYIRAMDYGIDQLRNAGLDLELINESHRMLVIRHKGIG